MSELAASQTPATAPQSPLSEGWTVFRHELRQFLLRPRTLLLMAVYAGFAALAVRIMLFVSQGARAQLEAAGTEGIPQEEIDRVVEEGVGQALALLGWGTVGDAAELFRDQVPLLVLFFFLLASYFLPLLVALVSFDQFSELSTRGARFALLRVRRTTWLGGKALAAAGSVALFLAVMWVLVVAVATTRGEAPVGAAVREGLRAWALMSVLSLPYLAVTAWVSSLARPRVAFLGVAGAWFFFSVGSWLVQTVIPYLLTNAGMPGPAEAVRRLVVVFPWSHAPALISRHDPTLWRGVGALLIIAAAWYAIALWVVRRRDA